MADGEGFEDPLSINTEESDDFSKAIVKLVIPGFTVEKKFALFNKSKAKAKPKPGESEADVQFSEWGFTVQAAVTKKVKSSPTTTKYFFKVNKLPSEIDVNDCSVEYDKELIILHLTKKEADTWLVKIAGGLDQEPDD